MKFIITFLLFVSSIITTFAQQEAFSFNLETQKHRFLASCIGSDGSMNYMFKNKNELETTWISGTKRSTAIISKIKKLKKLEMIGLHADSNNLYLYFFDPNIQNITLIQVNKKTEESTVTTQTVLSNSESLLKGFEMDGIFYILTVPYGKNELKISAFKEGKLVVTQKYIMECPHFWSALISGGSEIPDDAKYGQIGIIEIENSLPQQISTTTGYQKLYHYNHKIYFTFEESNTTHLSIIDPISQTNEYRKLNFKLDNDNGNSNKGNSYLYQNKLLRLTTSKEQLNLCVVSLDSFTLVKNHNIYKNQDNYLKNTPIYVETNGRNVNEIISDNDFFDELMEGEISISANSMGDNLTEVSIGVRTFEKQIYQDMQPRMMMGNGWGYGMFPYYSPTWGYYPVYNVSYISKVIYFKSLFKSNNFTHQTGLLNKNVLEKIKNFESDSFGNNPPDLHVVYSYGNKIHYGYYRDGNNSFVVREFSK